MIVDLKTIKFFNLLSHGLHNRCGKDSTGNRDFPWIFSAAASSAQFPLPNKFFQWESSPNDLHNLQQLVFSVGRHLTFHRDPRESGRSNTSLFDSNTSLSPLDAVATNFPLICPSLKSLTFDLPFSGRHVTRPNKGLFSLSPGCRKKRDPGNEVAGLGVDCFLSSP